MSHVFGRVVIAADAFLIGAAMPRGRFVEALREKLESVTVGVFLPFFFATFMVRSLLRSFSEDDPG